MTYWKKMQLRQARRESLTEAAVVVGLAFATLALCLILQYVYFY